MRDGSEEVFSMRWNPNPESFTVSKLPLSDEMQKSYDDSRYDWSPSTGGVLRLTKSSLFGYHFCPYQYWLEKFQGYRSEETMWMVRGSNVHRGGSCEYTHVTSRAGDDSARFDGSNANSAPP